MVPNLKKWQKQTINNYFWLTDWLSNWLTDCLSVQATDQPTNFKWSSRKPQLIKMLFTKQSPGNSHFLGWFVNLFHRGKPAFFYTEWSHSHLAVFVNIALQLNTSQLLQQVRSLSTQLKSTVKKYLQYRAVIKFWVTCSPVLHTCYKLVTLCFVGEFWLSINNCRQFQASRETQAYSAVTGVTDYSPYWQPCSITMNSPSFSTFS